MTSNKQTGSKKKTANLSMRLVLENRLLFDGAVVATAVETIDNTTALDTANDLSQDNSLGAESATDGNQFLDISANSNISAPLPTPPTDYNTYNTDNPNLIVIDSRAEDVHELLATPPVNTEIIVLDSNKDGFRQIANILASRGDTTHIALQTANVDGREWLGGTQITSNLGQSERDALMEWGNSLDSKAHITLHGAPIAGSNTLIDSIHGLTGSQVNWRTESIYDGDANEVKQTNLVEKSQTSSDSDNQPNNTTTLVFIDTTVKGYQEILKGIDTSAKVFLLDNTTDEIGQIADIVSHYDNINAINIISHGSDGQLNLGSSVLNSSSMQGQYARDLTLISQHLSENADILVYGCDFGRGELGLQTTQLLATLTGADVASSINDTGSTQLGGDWVLERSTGIIESGQVLGAAGMFAFEGLLDTPVPSLSLTGTTDVSIGSNFTFTATVDNTAGTGVGYAPYIDLVLPSTGKDGAGAALNDGIDFISATYLGQAVTATTLTFDAGGQASHPIAKDNSGAALVINGTPGDKLIVLELPFGSVTATQPTIPIVITASLSNLADIANNTTNDLSISARAGFRFGQDALNNPTTDPTIIGTTQTFIVHPTVVTMTQTFDGPENETATGPNYVRHLTTTTTPATGQSFTNFDVSQTLPNTIFVTAIHPNGGTITSITKGDGTVITNSAQITSTLSTGTFLQSYTVRYGTLNAAKDTVVDFYVPEKDSSNTSVLNATTGDDRTINIAPATGSGSWTPVDTRDTPTTVSINSNANTPITFDAKSIAVQKSVAIQTDTGVVGTSPGDKLEYTLKIDVSDFFAFGKNVSATGSWLVNDVLGDGQTWDNSFTPTLIYTDATGSHNITLNRGSTYTVGNLAGDNSGNKAADGKTYLQFDLATALTRLQGDLHSDAAANGASTVTISLRSTIDDNYVTIYSQNVLNEGDSVSNDVTTDGTLLNASLVLTGDNEADASSVISTITANQVVTSIVGINGSLGSPTQLKPGDLVTIKVRYDLATGDYENFKLKSFLPLPVLTTNDSNADGTQGDPWTAGGTWNGAGGNLPTVGQWKYGVDHTAGNVAGSVTADGTGNSLTFDFGNNSNLGNTTTTAEILYTIKVSDQPFADQLFLTLLAESSQQDTVTSSSNTSDALVNIQLAEPDVTIKTGVVKISNSGATITGTTGTWEAAGTGGSSVPFTGTISTANALDGNLTNFDGADTIRLATAVENNGGSEAFDVTTTIGAPPAGLSFVGGSLANANLKVARGDGILLAQGTDYSISGNTITFLDNGGIATLGVGRNGSTAINNGTNVVVITYDVTSDNTVNALQNFTTDATLTNYASTNNGPDFTTINLTDTATEVVAAPGVVKVFQGGSISNDDSNSPSTTGANVVIGESMVYDIKITLPEGNTQSLRLDDLVPTGMKLDTTFNTTGYELITTSAASGGSLNADFNGSVSVVGPLAATPSGTLGNDGVDGRLTFSAISSNTADNNVGNNTFVVRVRLIADDVIGNQAGNNLTTPAQLVFSDTDGTNGSGPVTDQTVASVGNPTVTVREPTLTINKTVSPSTPIDEGDSVQFTITITNSLSNNLNAYDLIYGDTFPSQLSSITLVSATKATTNDVFSAFQVVGNIVQTIDGTLGNAGVNLDLAPGETITLVVSGVANSTVAAVASFDSNSVVRWTSIDSTDNLPASQDGNERTGADGVGGALNDYAIQDGAPVTVQSVANLSHVGGLPDTVAPSPTTAPENVAIGEIIRYRAVVRIPEGSITNYNIQATLPSGLSYLNDGTTKVAFIYDSAGGSVSSSIGVALITSGALKVTGNETSPVASNIPTDLSNGPTAFLASSQIDVSNAQAPIFNFGTMTNNENDTGNEFVVVEFNARVDNITANTTVDSFNINFAARTGTSILATSNTVVENLVEPAITNLTKTVTSFNPSLISDPTTGRATMTLNFTNSGDGAANDIHLTDSVTSGSNYAISSVTIGGTSYTEATLPAGVTASTASGIVLDFSQLVAGTAVSVVYTVDVPNNAAIPSTNAVITFSGLPETFTTFADSSVGNDASSTGERDGSGGATLPNNYQDIDDAGLGIINGTLWDDTNNANGTIDGGEARLSGQTVTLVWAGVDGNLATAVDNLTFTTTTDTNGDYHFGTLPAGNYQITNSAGNTITVSGDTLKPRFDSDNTSPIGTINLTLSDASSSTGNIGYVQQNDAPVNVVGATRTVEKNTPTPISGISISDPDAGSSIMTTQLSVLHGTLQVTLPLGGAIITAGANNTDTLTLSGTQAQINTALATIVYSPIINYNGNDTMTLITNDKGNIGDFDGDGIPGEAIDDNRSDSDTIAIVVNFTDANELVRIPEDTQATGNVLLGTSSLQGPVTVTSFTVFGLSGTFNAGQSAVIPHVGTLVINSNGDYIFTPESDFNGQVPVATYTINDIAGQSDSSLLTISVDPLVDIQSDSDITQEDTPITLDVLANDGFGSGAVISAINGQSINEGGAAVKVTNGKVQLVGKKLIFTPDPDFNGTVPTFTYTVTSGSVIETANVDITVTPVNDPPVAVDNRGVKTEFSQTVKGNLLGNDSDPDKGNLTIIEFTIDGIPGGFVPGTEVNIPGVGTLSINSDGNYSFTPNPGYFGSVPEVTYTISNGHGISKAVLKFDDIPNSVDNIGALILLSNPTPPLFAGLAGGLFSLVPLREPNALIANENSYQIFSQNPLKSLSRCDLYLTGSLRNKVVLEEKSFSFAIPQDTFRHTDKNENLEYEATLPDGSQLPDWLQFHSNKISFTGIPPKGVMNTDVVVIARDHCGNKVHAQFRVIVNREHDYSQWHFKKDKLNHQPKNVDHANKKFTTKTGKPSFTDQISSTGKLNRLMEARQLLNGLEKI